MGFAFGETDAHKGLIFGEHLPNLKEMKLVKSLVSLFNIFEVLRKSKFPNKVPFYIKYYEFVALTLSFNVYLCFC